MNIFRLPDLGEGLVDVEIRSWHAGPGDTVQEDDLLVSVETAKAIVDIPSPRAGVIRQCYGDSGDIVQVGDPLVEFEGAADRRPDAGSVVGEVEVGSDLLRELPPGPAAAASVRATPAVRALARRLDVDLSVVTPSGPSDTVTADDVQRVARILQAVGPLQPLRGARRAMAVNMARAHAEVVPVTLCDEADVQAWIASGDITVRLVQAIARACRAEPALNAWYDSHSIGRRLIEPVHLGIAVDTADGLFVPVLRDAGSKDAAQLRTQLDKLKARVRDRSIAPDELRGQTITLSNFGTYAGRYANPVVPPPTVAILGAGRVHRSAVPAGDRIEVHALLPLSLTFDHRAVTGGEASRFLAALIAHLELPA